MGFAGVEGVVTPRVTVELIEDGCVTATQILGAGQWMVGDAPIAFSVDDTGGCVEGAPGALWVNGVATERAPVRSGDFITSGGTMLRVWLGEGPARARSRLSLAPLRPGLCVELWWRDRFIARWVTWDEVARPPPMVLALDGYVAGAAAATWVGASYRFFVPEGCEASEPVVAQHATVQLFRPLIISRAGLTLRVGLTSHARPSRTAKGAAGGVCFIALIGLMLLCGGSCHYTGHPSPQSESPIRPYPVRAVFPTRSSVFADIDIGDERSQHAYAQLNDCLAGKPGGVSVSWFQKQNGATSDISVRDREVSATTLQCLRHAIRELPPSTVEEHMGISLPGRRVYDAPTAVPCCGSTASGGWGDFRRLPPDHRAVVDAHLPQVMECFRTHSPRSANVTLRWTTRTDGLVESVRVIREPAGGSKLGQCLVGLLSRWAFARNQSGMHEFSFGARVTPGRLRVLVPGPSGRQ